MQSWMKVTVRQKSGGMKQWVTHPPGVWHACMWQTVVVQTHTRYHSAVFPHTVYLYVMLPTGGILGKRLACTSPGSAGTRGCCFLQPWSASWCSCMASSLWSTARSGKHTSSVLLWEISLLRGLFCVWSISTGEQILAASNCCDASWTKCGQIY